MRCTICDFCPDTEQGPTDNAVHLDHRGIPICLKCEDEIIKANAEFEYERLEGEVTQPTVPEVSE